MAPAAIMSPSMFETIHGNMKKPVIVTAALVLAVLLAWTGRTWYRAHRDIVSLDIRNATAAEAARSLERQSRERIVLARGLDEQLVTLRIGNEDLTETLERIAGQIGARSKTFYAVHGSRAALDRLVAALREGTDWELAGWSELASRYNSAQSFGIEPQAPPQSGTSIRIDAEDNLEDAIHQLGLSEAMTEEVLDRIWIPADATGGHSVKKVVLDPVIRVMKAGGNGSVSMKIVNEHLMLEAGLLGQREPQPSSSAYPEEARRLAEELGVRWTRIHVLWPGIAGHSVPGMVPGISTMPGDGDLPSRLLDRIHGDKARRMLESTPEQQAQRARARHAEGR